ncbi:phosphoserine phosphatase SerB [Paracoccaceae bacterium GXU_MW_L88]
MPVLVLTSAGGVSSDHVEAALASCAAPGAPNRLADTAVEIPCAAAAVSLRGVDCNLLPDGVREKKLLIADMDSTMITVECIDELADYAGVKAKVAEITERAMQGELDFEGALTERVALLKGLPLSALDQCYAERVHLSPGAAVAVKTMASRGAMTALVSGGFTAFSSKVAEAAGFLSHQANVLLDDGETLTGDVARPILGRDAKAEALAKICAERGIEASDVMAVGDGANDLAMIEAAGLGVAYKAKKTLRDAATARLDHSDLTALLALQGIPETDWVRD